MTLLNSIIQTASLKLAKWWECLRCLQLSLVIARYARQKIEQKQLGAGTLWNVYQSDVT